MDFLNPNRMIANTAAGALSKAVECILSSGAITKAGTQLVNGVVERSIAIFQGTAGSEEEKAEVMRKKASVSDEKKLDILFTEAIASQELEALEAKIQSLRDFSGQEQHLPEEQKARLRAFFQNVNQAEEIPAKLAVLIQAQQEIGSYAISSDIVTKTKKVGKEAICGFGKSLVGVLNGTLPPNAYQALYQTISRYQVDDAKSFRETGREIVKAFEQIEFYIQGWDISGFIRQVFETIQEEEEEEFFDAQEEEFFDAQEDAPASSPIEPQALRDLIKAQKEELLKNTNLFLILKLSYDACLPSQNQRFYLDWLNAALAPTTDAEVQSPERTLKDLVVQTAESEGFLKKIKAYIVWWFASKIIPFFVSNLFNHHFDAFYNNYISSQETPEINQKKLSEHIISHLSRYLAVLGGAYDRVARADKVSDDLEGLLAKELEDPCAYDNMTRKKLYERVIRYELSIALGGTLVARVSSFVVTSLFSWKLVPTVTNFIDSSIATRLNSNGYPHGINLILKKQLTNLRNTLKQSNTGEKPQLASLPLSEKKRLKGCVEQLLYILSRNYASSLESLKKGPPVESLLYNQAAESLTSVISQLMQDLSQDHQIEQLFLELVQNVNKVYTTPSEQSSEALAKEVDQEVKALTQEVLHLYIKKFIEDLDLSGKNRHKTFLDLLTRTKEQASSFISSTKQALEALKLTENGEQIAAISEGVQRLNAFLKDLNAYSLTAEHKTRLVDKNTEISSSQTQLLKPLEIMQRLVSEAVQKRNLSDVSEKFKSLSTSFSNVQKIKFDDLGNLKSQTEKYNVSVLPVTWTQIETACESFEKNRQEKEEIEGILADLRNKKEEALAFLEKQHSIIRNPLEMRLLSSERKTLMQAILPLEDEAPSKWITLSRKLGLSASPITTEDQTQALERIRAKLALQATDRSRNIETQKLALKRLVSGIQDRITQKIKTLTNKPSEAFNEAKTQLQDALRKFQNYERHFVIPALFNGELVSNKKITDIVFTLIKIPGFAERYLESMTHFLSKKETYSRGLLPHLVLLPLIGRGKTPT